MIKQQIFVLIAAYNEERMIGQVIRDLRHNGYGNIVIVDDGSDDGTYRAARAEGATVLRHIVNRGQGAALQTGAEHILAKGGRVIVHFDADGQHSAEDIERLAAPVVNGQCDVAFGSRFLGTVRNMPVARRALLKLAVWFSSTVSGIKLTDAHNGLRALSSDVFRQIALTEDRFAHASELTEKIIKAGLRYREVPVTVTYTAYSLGKGQKNTNALNILFRMLYRRCLK